MSSMKYSCTAKMVYTQSPQSPDPTVIIHWSQPAKHIALNCPVHTSTMYCQHAMQQGSLMHNLNNSDAFLGIATLTYHPTVRRMHPVHTPIRTVHAPTEDAAITSPSRM